LRRAVVGVPKASASAMRRRQLEGRGLRRHWLGPAPMARSATDGDVDADRGGGGSTGLRWPPAASGRPRARQNLWAVPHAPLWAERCHGGTAPRVAPWWCGGCHPCCARCGTAVVPTSSATVAGGGFRLLLVHAAAGTRQLCGGVDRLVGLVRRREVGTTTVRRSYNGGRWCAASGTSPRWKWLQEWCWLPASNGGSGVRGSGRKPLPDSFWWIGDGALGCCSPCSGRHFGAITLPLEVYG
jgi:hypothetical protein